MKLFSLNEMRRYGLYATDGLVGSVKEFYFDDDGWVVRYLVADTGNWLAGRLVLIAPHAVGHADWEEASLEVDLSRQQVEDSPPISADRPVSRRLEEQLIRHYGWPKYWTDKLVGTGVPPLADLPEGEDEPEPPTGVGDPHLRSSREVTGYGIEAADGDIGHVHDFVVDIDSWRIVSLVVDTRNWLPGRKVLIAPGLIHRIRWSDKRVRILPDRRTVRECPKYDSPRELNHPIPHDPQRQRRLEADRSPRSTVRADRR
jgi:hypothetical protein